MKPETRKEEIIRVSAKLFKEKGYSAVTMRDLAKTMGIKAASLYNHIDSKQDILKSIIISLAEQFTAGMDEITKTKSSSIEKLKAIIKLHVYISGNNINGMASLNNDWMHLEDQLDYYLDLRTGYEDKFREIIQKGMDKGEIVQGKPDVLLFSILSTLRSLYLWMPKKEALDADELASDLSDILIEGIIKK